MDRPYFVDRDPSLPKWTNRDFLRKNPEHQLQTVGSRFSKLAGGKFGEDVAVAAMKHNLMFAPDEYDHGSLRNVSSSQNPVLWMEVFMHAEQGISGPEAVEIIALADWVTANIHLPEDVKRQLQNARDKLAGEKLKRI